LTSKLACSFTICDILPCAPKKYDEAEGIWQARVNDAWRFYFTVEGDVYHLHEIKAHPQ